MRVHLPLVLTVAALAAPAARADIRAVVVGVGDYQTLDADLLGPANDARLMTETLLARGLLPDKVTVLTTDPTGLPPGVASAQPDKAAILAALDTAARASVPGDTVVFYFSGHGAQAPDLSGDEGGGYDELLLPADAKGWKGAIGAVENAIVDDELQSWAQSTLSRGIRVVGLIDACHSATGFRAVGGQGVARVLDDATLGIPEDVQPVAGDPAPPLTGEFVFLYSSQSDQRSFEFPLADGTTWHGEFTLRLTQVLRDAPQASWAQVLVATTAAMAQGPARQVPEGEGSLLTAQVFGAGSGAARYAVTGDTLAAGLLDGMATGATVALYSQAAGGEALAVLPLATVTAREAVLGDTVPAGAQWAELIAAPPPAPLALAAPVRADPADGFDYSEWIAALPAPGPTADLVPILTDGVVALAGPDAALDPVGPGSSPRITPAAGETPAQAIARSLDQAAHGLRLRQVLTGASGRSLTGKPAVTLAIDHLAAQGGCDRFAPAIPFDAATPVAPCDQLWLTLTNTGGKAQDLSVLYFAADFQVQPIWPTQNLANRLAPGESVRVGLQIQADSPAGLEEIWVLAVPVDPDAPRVDLTGLTDTDRTRALGSADPMSLWLSGQIDPDSTDRGFTLKPAPLNMILQPVRLQPGTNAPIVSGE